MKKILLSNSRSECTRHRDEQMQCGRRKRKIYALEFIASVLVLSMSCTQAFHTSPNELSTMKSQSFRVYDLRAVATPSILRTTELVKGINEMKGIETKPLSKIPPLVMHRDKKGIPVFQTTTKTSFVKVKANGVNSAQRRRRKGSPRSSTMPGFRTGMTNREKAYQDGIRLVEERSGKKISHIVNTPEARRKLRVTNGEAMYKKCASVPESLVSFAREIHSIDRISAKEEITLGEKTQEVMRLQSLHNELKSKLRRPPTDDEWCAEAGKINLLALRQALDEGMEAKNKLVTSNLRMVQGVVNLYIRNGLGGQYNAGDMMQEGILALIRAAEKFDPERGFRFSTYAMYWIRSAVKRTHTYQSQATNIPQRMFENHKRLLRVEDEFTKSQGRKPSKKELGLAAGMSEMQIDRCMKVMSQRWFSLDQPIQNRKKPMNGDSNEDTMIDLVQKSDGGHKQQLRHLFRADLIQTLHLHLTAEEVELILLRYGLIDNMPLEYGLGPLTIAELSRFSGMKPDKVRRTINKCLSRLKVIMDSEWQNMDLEMQP